MSEPVVLEAAGARVVIDPDEGARLASVVVGADELIWDHRPDGPIRWGSYPMAPWAGRVRRGRFAFEGRTYDLPLGMPPHAIHGVAYDRPWEIAAADARSATFRIALDRRWPFGGHVRQALELTEDGLATTLTLEADEPMPATIGWHPWFRRRLASGGPEAELRFAAREMLVRDADGMPSGERRPPGPRPWDDAFTGVDQDPSITWPGRLRLTISSTCRWWVVYTEPEHALCVEPQSGPPDALNTGAEIVRPGHPLTHRMDWAWERLG
jgi:galactose mutarotase-like enzyme